MPKNSKDDKKEPKYLKSNKRFKRILIAFFLIIILAGGLLIYLIKEMGNLEGNTNQTTVISSDDGKSTLARIRAKNSSSAENTTDMSYESSVDSATDISQTEASEGGVAPPMRINQDEPTNSSSSNSSEGPSTSTSNSGGRTIATPGVIDEQQALGSLASTPPQSQSQQPSESKSSNTVERESANSSSYVSSIKEVDVSVIMKVQKRLTIKSGDEINFTDYVTCVNSLGENLNEGIKINQTNFDNKKTGVYNIHYIYQKGLGSMKNTMIVTVQD